ncbi:MAG: hypothetical protein OEZ59_05950 [Deltaproteobacteria bacterium]|nr:hypothetical protein [Deltaproteobacteria bacterium]
MMLQNKAKGVRISESEIQEALKRFRSQGGLIKRLPAQQTPQNNLVGARYGIYEPVLVVGDGLENLG